MINKKYLISPLFLLGMFVLHIGLVSAKTDKIYVIGDSMTSVGYKFANLMSSDNSWQVINLGVGGTCTDAIAGQLQSVIAAGDAGYVIIWGGTNDELKYVFDSKSGCAYANGNKITANDIEKNLQMMYDSAHNAGIKVVTIGLSPTKNNIYVTWTAEMQEIQDTVNAWMATARNVDYFIPVYDQLKDGQIQYQLNTNYSYTDPNTNKLDYLHLNDAGNALVGELIKTKVTWTHSVDTSNVVDCAKNTCVGTSCYNETGYVYGTKTEGCPTCIASFSPTSLTVPGTSNLTFSSSGTDKLLGYCTGPIPIPEGDYGLAYSGYPFPFTTTQTGTETCIFTPYNGATVGATCSASVIVNANNTTCECTTNAAFGGGDPCTGGYCDGCHCVYNAIPGVVVNGVCGSANGQAFSSAPNANLCSAGMASIISGSGPWTWTCSGSGGGTTANCNATKSSGACECTTNAAFGGGDPCTGGTCDGCHCDYSDCKSNCACAADVLVGSTCSNGCGGYCNGTKTDTPAPNPDSNCGTAANSNYACEATQTSGTLCVSGVTCYPNAGYPPSPCPTTIAFSETQAHWYCGTDQNCYAKKQTDCSKPTPVPDPIKNCANMPNPTSFCPNGEMITIGTDSNGCSIYDCKQNLPTGADCAQKVCLGNSCWNGTNYVAGAKTTDCATGQAKASPNSVTPITEWTAEHPAKEISYITWTSTGASKMEAACNGPVIIARGGWYLNTEEWYGNALTTYKKPTEATPSGYPSWFHVGTSGTEVCTFYPTNKFDGLPGTPFSTTIQVTGAHTCGNNVVEDQEDCDYNPSSGGVSYVPCPEGKTCADCKCVVESDNKYVCQPDDPNCAKSTCKNVKCFDGCNKQQGIRDCDGLN